MSDSYSQLYSNFTSIFYGYGLDFGTYQSMMAYNDNGKKICKVAPYERELQYGIPSLFWYTKNNLELCCDEVINQNGLLDDPSGVCTSIKTKLSQDKITLHNKDFDVAYIAEKEIRRIISLSHKAFESEFITPEYQKLVVGVPVRFGVAEKNLLIQILKKATNNKEIILLPEPIAAAICYSHFEAKETTKTLVYDLGAGTFDTVLLVPNKHRTNKQPYLYKALYPDGLPIAGDYFDQQMAELIVSKLKLNGCKINTDILSNPVTADHRRLMNTARIMKEKLSTSSSTQGLIEGTDNCHNPCIEKVTIDRIEFEKVIRPAIIKTVSCMSKVLTQANEQNNSDINILLVGGSTYIPLVKTIIKETFPHISESHILQRCPEQAIALGCAIYANKEVSDKPIAYAYAIGAYRKSDSKDILDIKIPSNANLPYSVDVNYRTASPNQTSISFHFYEVEHGEKDMYLDIEDGNYTDLCATHAFNREVPENTKVNIKVTLTPNGVLDIIIDDHGITPVDHQNFVLSKKNKE